MKVCLLTDFHFGVKNDSKEFLKYQERFFEEQLFPFLRENKITQIISLGDEFDSRKNINYHTLHQAKKMFFDRVEQEKYELYIIIGNHNVFHKHENEINSPKLLFNHYEHIHVVEDVTHLSFDNVKFLLVPWINKNNDDKILESIKNTDAQYLLGHFEVSGVKLHKDWSFADGLHHDLLKKFKQVWSGHYHLKLKIGNFKYLGTPYQLSWVDVNHEKGFYVFDTNNEKLIFKENDLKIFHVVDYTNDLDIEDFDYKKYSESYVRVVLSESIEGYNKFDLFIKRMEDSGAYDVKVDEKFFENLNPDSGDIIEEGDFKKEESTIDTIKKRCDEVDFVNKELLFKFMEKNFLKSKELLNSSI